MTCRHSQELLAAFLEGDLEAATRDQLDVHLAKCNDCSEELHVLRQVDRLLKNVNVMRCPDGLWETLNHRMAQAPLPKMLPRSHNQLAPAWSLAVAAALLAFAWNPQQSARYFVVHSETQPAPAHTAPTASVRNLPAVVPVQHIVVAPVSPTAPVRPVVQPAKQIPPSPFPALAVRPPDSTVVTPPANVTLPSYVPPTPEVIVDRAAPQEAPLSSSVQPVSHPIIRTASKRFLVHSTWNPSPAVFRTRQVIADVQASPSMAGAETVAPAEESSAPSTDTVSSTPPAVTAISTSATPPVLPSEDETVQGTVAVAAQNQSGDSDALEQARKDMYGMSLEAGGTTMTASLPASAGA